jgi:hypothetical protein
MGNTLLLLLLLLALVWAAAKAAAAARFREFRLVRMEDEEGSPESLV